MWPPCYLLISTVTLEKQKLHATKSGKKFFFSFFDRWTIFGFGHAGRSFWLQRCTRQNVRSLQHSEISLLSVNRESVDNEICPLY